jgi:hypothetical protein
MTRSRVDGLRLLDRPQRPRSRSRRSGPASSQSGVIESWGQGAQAALRSFVLGLAEALDLTKLAFETPRPRSNTQASVWVPQDHIPRWTGRSCALRRQRATLDRLVLPALYGLPGGGAGRASCNGTLL